jgi:hypothetical protein
MSFDDRALRELAARVEPYFSPALRAQLLEADLSLANALRELVEIERAKFNSTQIAKMLPSEGNAMLVFNRAKKKPNAPDLVGSGCVGGCYYLISAWKAFSPDGSATLRLRFTLHPHGPNQQPP